MALFRKFFNKKPPDGLLHIADNIYVFDHCFSMKEIEEENFEAHIKGIATDLLENFNFRDHSFMISNFGTRKEESPIYHILSEYEMTVLDHPGHYEGCPLLTMEMIHCILKCSESWLSLGQHNMLLMHCEKGCWPLLVFILAALLIYLGHYSDEQKTLDMLYKLSSLELLEMFSPLNPTPSQMRYLSYISMKNIMSEWPPSDRALALDCVILRMVPNFHGQGGFRPIIRIYGPDPLKPTDQTPKVLFSTPKKSNIVRFYSQEDELVKINLQCHVQGDVVLEFINLCEDLEREEMVFRIMFNTAFIRSNILMLNRDHVDMLWNSKDQFPKDFRLEVIFSDMDAITSHITTEPVIHQRKQGLGVEEFAKVLDIFNHMDWLDGKRDIVPHTAQLKISTISDDPTEKESSSTRTPLSSSPQMIAQSSTPLSSSPAKLRSPPPSPPPPMNYCNISLSQPQYVDQKASGASVYPVSAPLTPNFSQTVTQLQRPPLRPPPPPPYQRNDLAASLPPPPPPPLHNRSLPAPSGPPPPPLPPPKLSMDSNASQKMSTVRPPPPPPPPPTFSSGAKNRNTAHSKSPRSLRANQSSKRTPLKPQEELDFDNFSKHVKSSTAIPKLQVPQRLSELRVLQILQEPSLGENFTSRTDDTLMELNRLERGVNEFDKPINLKLSLLKIITDNFSDELKIGQGGCGVVYKGILRNGIIAVKRLLKNHTVDDRMFHQEVQSLMMIKHQNTVRFLGYCSHTEEQAMDLAGKVILVEIRERLLCFEYLGNGSLKDHITDELRGLEWQTRYQIILGICEGLHHLHKENRIIHMDLKPANILLDEHMVPKITDFGLSRPDEKSQTMSEERLLSQRYCAPEYQNQGKMSAKSDIYSLGVIIRELVTGSKEKPSTTTVLRRWKHRWNKSVKDKQSGYKQVAKCLDLAQRCMHTDPTYRPDIWNIISDLHKMNSVDVHNSCTTECLELEDMLGIEPLEMHLPFKFNRQVSCSIELTNDTGRYFVFRIFKTSLRPYYIVPIKDIVPPRSKFTVNITLQAIEKAPPQNQCKDEFTVQSTMVDGNLRTMDITGEMFDEEHGKVVDKVDFMIVLDAP